MTFRNVLAALAVLSLVALVGAGCGVSTDAQGKPISDRVWFDREGKAHCPFCYPSPVPPPAAKSPDPAVDEEAADLWKKEVERWQKSIVPLGKTQCPADKTHIVRWTTEDTPCWRCDGSGICQSCGGAALTNDGPGGAARVCQGCVFFSETEAGAATGLGRGRCPECDPQVTPGAAGHGMIRQGTYGPPSR